VAFQFNSDTRVYIAGCGGMLGEAVYAAFSARSTVLATDIDTNEAWLSYADVRDYAGIEKSVRDFKPDLLINLAALTDLELCERDSRNAWLTNALGAENLALIAGKLNVPYVYISTAGIFDGAQDIYNDFDEPNPLSVYAKSKFHGERFAQRHLREHFVFRAGWMMGGGERKDKKFVNKIYQQLKVGRDELLVVDDKAGTPTYTRSFAANMINVIESEQYGVYNQVCGGDCSRYDVACELVRLLGCVDTVKVTAVSSDYFQSEYFAPRPRSERLVNLKLDARGLNGMPHWKDALAEYSLQFPMLVSRSA
jgi:dTDP-4-dehydrorhamnose reductase